MLHMGGQERDGERWIINNGDNTSDCEIETANT